MTYFNPLISYWSNRGNRVSPKGLQQPSRALNHTSLLLLIHGYNNDQGEASASYNRFVQLQKELHGGIKKNVVGVYWPGDNWEGPVYYMQAIGKAKEVAPKLANDLYQQARDRGYLEVDIIAHSLGCRLTLEMVKQLLLIKEADSTLAGLVLKQVVFMAGAVPTKYIEDLSKLRNALTSFNSQMSIYSEKDYVLKYAFPVGQSLVLERFLPVALGRQKWVNGNAVGSLRQVQNTGAGHSDYWGGADKNLDKKRQAAKIVDDFMQLSKSPVRTLDARSLSTRDIADRNVSANRSTVTR